MDQQTASHAPSGDHAIAVDGAARGGLMSVPVQPLRSQSLRFHNSIILIDPALRASRDGESAIVGRDDRKRLSIRGQRMVPLRTLIGGSKAKRSTPSSATG